MNRLISRLLVGSTLSLAFALPAFAETPPAAPAPTPKVAAKPAAPKPVVAKPEAPKAQHIQGDVVSVSAKDHTITLKTATGEQVLVVAAKAKLTSNKLPIALDAIKAGQKLDGSMIAVDGKPTLQRATLSS